MEKIIALILLIAAEFGLPPYYVLSVALTENETLDPLAVNVNKNGTRDLGVMQINSSWFKGDWQDPETNIRAGCQLIRELINRPESNTYWYVCILYNAGTAWLRTGKPPPSSLNYADKVMAKWNELTFGNAPAIINK